jgi:hypothetical protein
VYVAGTSVRMWALTLNILKSAAAAWVTSMVPANGVVTPECRREPIQ